MKSPYKTRWRRGGPCCICGDRLTAQRHSRYCCSEACDDKAEANMKAATARGKARLRRFFAGKPQPDPDADPYHGGSAHQALERAETTDEEPDGQPIMMGKGWL